MIDVKYRKDYILYKKKNIYIYISVTFQMLFFGLQKGYPDMRWTCPRWHPKPQASQTSHEVFPYWRLSDLKRAAGRVLAVRVGELTTAQGTLLKGEGISIGEAGRRYCSYLSSKGRFFLCLGKGGRCGGGKMQQHFSHIFFSRLSKTSTGTSGECTGFRLQPCR